MTPAVMRIGASQGSRQRPAEPARGGADFVGAEGTAVEPKLEGPRDLEAARSSWQTWQSEQTIHVSFGTRKQAAGKAGRLRCYHCESRPRSLGAGCSSFSSGCSRG
ncbi:hypothetical protein CUJ84_pRLN1000724 (plasmid) [Rhizobium leguminosarum]|uniref:Uncharacterized protein n=1 Tax=Rhizobium leguminosarum TaxID=384 RepID=A0A2K9ZD67_RHILE|nr:hypothetical protein CUJ84_pRLN1000724 [Rhizobium leguminosarum]